MPEQSGKLIKVEYTNRYLYLVCTTHDMIVLRSDEVLFRLLIEEKSEETKNKRFVQDFKTLADVLIQEMVKEYLGSQVRVSHHSNLQPNSMTYCSLLMSR